MTIENEGMALSQEDATKMVMVMVEIAEDPGEALEFDKEGESEMEVDKLDGVDVGMDEVVDEEETSVLTSTEGGDRLDGSSSTSQGPCDPLVVELFPGNAGSPMNIPTLMTTPLQSVNTLSKNLSFGS